MPGTSTGSTPGEGFQGGGRSPASSVVRSESCSRRGVLLRDVGPGVVIGKSGTTNVEAEPAGKGGGTGAAGENGSGGGFFLLYAAWVRSRAERPSVSYSKVVMEVAWTGHNLQFTKTN